MLKRGILVVSLAALALGVAYGCGSSDNPGGSNGGSAGAGAMNGVGGNINTNGASGNSGASGAAGASGAGGGNVGDLRDAACAGWSSEPELLPAVLFLVVDVSGSMESQAPGGGGSKWAITRDALLQAMDALPPSTAVGVIYYPNLAQSPPASTTARPVTACVNTNAMIPVGQLGAMGSAQRNRIAQSLRQADTGGGTPTHDAYKYGVEQGMIPAMFPGNRYMLLITDGQPTFSLECIGTGRTQEPVNEQPIVDQVAAASQQNIRTFIIGSPGSEDNVSTGADARPWLSRAARAGNTAAAGCADTAPNFCHMDMTQAPNFSTALRDGLAQIVGTVARCDYAMPTAPGGQRIDLNKINVISTPSGGDPTILPRSTDPNCTEGWRLDNNNNVVLCSGTCDQVKADTGAAIEVLYGCGTIGGPPA
jgi:hypothetical protein